jgi:hypothetical protein
MFELEWVGRAKSHRALTLTPAGHKGLGATFGVEIDL